VCSSDLSFSGELGYEIYVEPEYQLKLYESILEAGEDLGLTHYGLRALMSMRLEKNWGAWTLDFRPDFTAAQSGLDVFINWNKDFIGKEAAFKERDDAPTIKLVTMTIDTDDIDVSNDEAILKDGECVGYITSGSYAHHVQKSMALGYVPTELAAGGTELEVEINGEMYSTRVVGVPLYDPSGEKMRS
jgi:dimethylglycine dehydrogenase